MASGMNVGELNIRVGLDAENLDRELRSLRGKLGSVRRKLNQALSADVAADESIVGSYTKQIETLTAAIAKTDEKRARIRFNVGVENRKAAKKAAKASEADQLAANDRQLRNEERLQRAMEGTRQKARQAQERSKRKAEEILQEESVKATQRRNAAQLKTQQQYAKDFQRALTVFSGGTVSGRLSAGTRNILENEVAKLKRAAKKAKQDIQPAEQLGADIAEGVASGIRKSKVKPVAEMKSAMQEIIEAGRAAVRAQSPSKDGEDLGTDIMRGILNGIIKGRILIGSEIAKTLSEGLSIKPSDFSSFEDFIKSRARRDSLAGVRLDPFGQILKPSIFKFSKIQELVDLTNKLKNTQLKDPLSLASEIGGSNVIQYYGALKKSIDDILNASSRFRSQHALDAQQYLVELKDQLSQYQDMSIQIAFESGNAALVQEFLDKIKQLNTTVEEHARVAREVNGILEDQGDLFQFGEPDKFEAFQAAAAAAAKETAQAAADLQTSQEDLKTSTKKVTSAVKTQTLEISELSKEIYDAAEALQLLITGENKLIRGKPDLAAFSSEMSSKLINPKDAADIQRSVEDRIAYLKSLLSILESTGSVFSKSPQAEAIRAAIPNLEGFKDFQNKALASTKQALDKLLTKLEAMMTTFQPQFIDAITSRAFGGKKLSGEVLNEFSATFGSAREIFNKIFDEVNAYLTQLNTAGLQTNTEIDSIVAKIEEIKRQFITASTTLSNYPISTSSRKRQGGEAALDDIKAKLESSIAALREAANSATRSSTEIAQVEAPIEDVLEKVSDLGQSFAQVAPESQTLGEEVEVLKAKVEDLSDTLEEANPDAKDLQESLTTEGAAAVNAANSNQQLSDSVDLVDASATKSAEAVSVLSTQIDKLNESLSATQTVAPEALAKLSRITREVYGITGSDPESQSILNKLSQARAVFSTAGNTPTGIASRQNAREMLKKLAKPQEIDRNLIAKQVDELMNSMEDLLIGQADAFIESLKNIPDLQTEDRRDLEANLYAENLLIIAERIQKFAALASDPFKEEQAAYSILAAKIARLSELIMISTQSGGEQELIDRAVELVESAKRIAISSTGIRYKPVMQEAERIAASNENLLKILKAKKFPEEISDENPILQAIKSIVEASGRAILAVESMDSTFESFESQIADTSDQAQALATKAKNAANAAEESADSARAQANREKAKEGSSEKSASAGQAESANVTLDTLTQVSRETNALAARSEGVVERFVQSRSRLDQALLQNVQSFNAISSAIDVNVAKIQQLKTELTGLKNVYNAELAVGDLSTQALNSFEKIKKVLEQFKTTGESLNSIVGIVNSYNEALNSFVINIEKIVPTLAAFTAASKESLEQVSGVFAEVIKYAQEFKAVTGSTEVEVDSSGLTSFANALKQITNVLGEIKSNDTALSESVAAYQALISAMRAVENPLKTDNTNISTSTTRTSSLTTAVDLLTEAKNKFANKLEENAPKLEAAKQAIIDMKVEIDNLKKSISELNSSTEFKTYLSELSKVAVDEVTPVPKILNALASSISNIKDAVNNFTIQEKAQSLKEFAQAAQLALDPLKALKEIVDSSAFKNKGKFVVTVTADPKLADQLKNVSFQTSATPAAMQDNDGQTAGQIAEVAARNAADELNQLEKELESLFAKFKQNLVEIDRVTTEAGQALPEELDSSIKAAIQALKNEALSLNQLKDIFESLFGKFKTVELADAPYRAQFEIFDEIAAKISTIQQSSENLQTLKAGAERLLQIEEETRAIQRKIDFDNAAAAAANAKIEAEQRAIAALEKRTAAEAEAASVSKKAQDAQAEVTRQLDRREVAERQVQAAQRRRKKSDETLSVQVTDPLQNAAKDLQDATQSLQAAADVSELTLEQRLKAFESDPDFISVINTVYEKDPARALEYLSQAEESLKAAAGAQESAADKLNNAASKQLQAAAGGSGKGSGGGRGTALPPAPPSDDGGNGPRKKPGLPPDSEILKLIRAQVVIPTKELSTLVLDRLEEVSLLKDFQAEAAIELLNAWSRYFEQIGQFKPALDRAQAAATIAETVLGLESPKTANALRFMEKAKGTLEINAAKSPSNIVSKDLQTAAASFINLQIASAKVDKSVESVTAAFQRLNSILSGTDQAYIDIRTNAPELSLENLKNKINELRAELLKLYKDDISRMVAEAVDPATIRSQIDSIKQLAASELNVPLTSKFIKDLEDVYTKGLFQRKISDATQIDRSTIEGLDAYKAALTKIIEEMRALNKASKGAVPYASIKNVENLLATAQRLTPGKQLTRGMSEFNRDFQKIMNGLNTNAGLVITQLEKLKKQVQDPTTYEGIASNADKLMQAVTRIDEALARAARKKAIQENSRSKEELDKALRSYKQRVESLTSKPVVFEGVLDITSLEDVYKQFEQIANEARVAAMGSNVSPSNRRRLIQEEQAILIKAREHYAEVVLAEVKRLKNAGDLNKAKQLAVKLERRETEQTTQRYKLLDKIRREITAIDKTKTWWGRFGGAGGGFDVKELASSVFGATFGAYSFADLIENIVYSFKEYIKQSVVAANEFDRISYSLSIVSKNAETYSSVMTIARENQRLFGGTLSESVREMSGFTLVARTAGVELESLNSVAQRLALFDPGQGITGASTALREFLAGNIRSLRERFEIPSNILAEIGDKNLSAEQKIARLSTFLDQQGLSLQNLRGQLSQSAQAYRDFSIEWEQTTLKIGNSLQEAFAPLVKNVASFMGRMNLDIQQIAADLAKEDSIKQGQFLDLAVPEINEKYIELAGKKVARLYSESILKEMRANPNMALAFTAGSALTLAGGIGGAQGGAALGATVGSVIPGAGTAVGGVLGAILGGGAGILGTYAATQFGAFNQNVQDPIRSYLESPGLKAKLIKALEIAPEFRTQIDQIKEQFAAMIPYTTVQEQMDFLRQVLEGGLDQILTANQKKLDAEIASPKILQFLADASAGEGNFAQKIKERSAAIEQIANNASPDYVLALNNLINAFQAGIITENQFLLTQDAISTSLQHSSVSYETLIEQKIRDEIENKKAENSYNLVVKALDAAADSAQATAGEMEVLRKLFPQMSEFRLNKLVNDWREVNILAKDDAIKNAAKDFYQNAISTLDSEIALNNFKDAMDATLTTLGPTAAQIGLITGALGILEIDLNKAAEAWRRYRVSQLIGPSGVSELDAEGIARGLTPGTPAYENWRKGAEAAAMAEAQLQYEFEKTATISQRRDVAIQELSTFEPGTPQYQESLRKLTDINLEFLNERNGGTSGSNNDLQDIMDDHHQKVEDAEKDHKERLLELERDFNARKKELERESFVTKEEQRYQFYVDKVLESQLPPNILEGFKAEYEQIWAKAREMEQQGEYAKAAEFEEKSISLLERKIDFSERSHEATVAYNEATASGDQAAIKSAQERLDKLAAEKPLLDRVISANQSYIDTLKDPDVEQFNKDVAEEQKDYAETTTSLAEELKQALKNYEESQRGMSGASAVTTEALNKLNQQSIEAANRMKATADSTNDAALAQERYNDAMLDGILISGSLTPKPPTTSTPATPTTVPAQGYGPPSLAQWNAQQTPTPTPTAPVSSNPLPPYMIQGSVAATPTAGIVVTAEPTLTASIVKDITVIATEAATEAATKVATETATPSPTPTIPKATVTPTTPAPTNTRQPTAVLNQGQYVLVFEPVVSSKDLTTTDTALKDTTVENAPLTIRLADITIENVDPSGYKDIIDSTYPYLNQLNLLNSSEVPEYVNNATNLINSNPAKTQSDQAIAQFLNNLLSTLEAQLALSTISSPLAEKVLSTDKIPAAADSWWQSVEKNLDITGKPDIKSRLKTTYASFGEDLGTSYMQGISKGIETASAAAVTAARGSVKAIVDGSKKELEAKSPSKLTAREVGVPFVQGIIQGINRASGDLVKAVRAVVQTANATAASTVEKLPKGIQKNQNNIDAFKNIAQTNINILEQMRQLLPNPRQAAQGRASYVSAISKIDQDTEAQITARREKLAQDLMVARTEDERRIIQAIADQDLALLQQKASIQKSAQQEEMKNVINQEQLNQKLAEIQQNAADELKIAQDKMKELAKKNPTKAAEAYQIEAKKILDIANLRQEIARYMTENNLTQDDAYVNLIRQQIQQINALAELDLKGTKAGNAAINNIVYNINMDLTGSSLRASDVRQIVQQELNRALSSARGSTA